MKVHCAHDKLAKIDSLKPHPKNNNKHPEEQIKRLAKILDYQGWRYPIKISKQSGFITSGHARLEAAKANGWKKVPVNIQDYESDEQEYADITADNAIASWSELDLSSINAEIGELGPDFDIELLGLKDFELEPADKIPMCDEDEVPEPKESITKLGDLWILGEHRLLCGDSTDILQVEKLMNGEKADMVFTDPPYGVDYKGIKNDDRNGLPDLICQSFDNFLLSMKTGASIYCFHSDKCADVFNNEFRKRFHFSSMIIWKKPSLVMGQSDYQSIHEPCMYGWLEGEKHSWFSDRKQTSVWEFGRENFKEHTTPKPVKLIEAAISNSSRPKWNVLDLFGGSGSTLIACEKTNRKCYMMELDPHYCDVIVARWEKYTGKKAVLDGAA